ncbi:MAG: AMP-binding protein [Bryobacteraceae bacterium]|nr:AMP-binding protein [Bryobacteraceae bacterium]
MNRAHLLELFETWAQTERPLFAYDDGYRTVALSTGATARASWAFAHTLEQAGVQPGDRILLWGENRPGWVIALWGCLLRGAVAVPMDARSTTTLVERVRAITEAKGIVIGDEVTWPGAAWRMAELERASAPPGKLAKGDVGALAEILFTSGATAEPKGVRITHRNLLANLNPVEGEIRRYRAKPIVRWFAEPVFFPVRFLNLLPLSHLFGQTMAAFIPPMIDGQVIFLKGHHPPEIVRQVRRRRISVIVAVPKMLEMLREYVTARCPEVQAPSQPSGLLRTFWRYRRVHRLLGWKCWAFIVGAAPLDPELEAFWRRLGYAVIQGYGLTETAPIVSLNHPFHASHGTVGKPIPGVEMKLAEDGEILVRGENITSGYYGSDATVLEADGWFRTGDIGELDSSGALRIRGRKKEMIVAADGTNIFPDDLERVLDALPGVRESAVVEREGRAHAVLSLTETTTRDAVLAKANARLEPHQQIRDATLWPAGTPLPRTAGTEKLKRSQVRDWLHGIAAPVEKTKELGGVLARYGIRQDTKLNELGLSSLERVQLLMELEERTGQPVDESLFTRAETLAQVSLTPAKAEPPLDFPTWTRQAWARALRRVSLPTWVLPLARIFLWVRVRGLEHLEKIQGPVLFAVNHQSYFDTAALLIALPSRWRYRVAVAMRKEFFDAHYHPDSYGLAKRLRNSLGYYLACLMFSAFPLPQREAGTKDALRYMGELLGEGWSVVIFPEGRHADGDQIAGFQPGIGMMASRLGAPVIPVRLRGVHRVLHREARVPRPGTVEVAFGAPVLIKGSDYSALAHQIETAVKNL